ncbi:hypothetical protein GCM10007103_19000 [Salinimicrobium marinum]|uniref:Blue (type 1) copper domain-containing protein n=2 Tax=Salinimicrobium marinum TaxID=680283 RepID=A0A918SE82_9FLAO|nr:hypothetical protein GCM10007103_19000 [Salinimicrobium marinum]
MISCGNNQKEEEERITIGDNNQLESTETSEGTTSTTDTGSEASETSEDGVVEVSITGNDQMQFNKNELRVKAGQTVRLTLNHSGQLAENVMGHNVVILKQGTDVTDFGTRAASARDNDYIPADSDEVIAHTEMIGGGESTTIEFEAPEAGTYTFICSFPGHYVQMQGEFIVE